MTRTRVIGLLALVAIAVAVWVGFRTWSARKSGPVYAGTVETREIQVGSKVGGRVTDVFVEEGQQVQAQAELVRFEDDELKAERVQAQAKVEQAEADLAKMERGNRPEEIAQAEATAATQRALLDEAKNGPRTQEIQQAEADYAAAKVTAANAAVNFGRMETLIRGETVSRQQYDDAKALRDSTAQSAESLRQRLALLQAGTRREDVQAAEDRYKQAEAQAELMRRGFRKEDVDSARAQVAAAKGQVEQIDTQLREAVLVAPASGIVEVVSVRPGDLVPAGRIVMTMLEQSQLWVKVYVPETELGKVRVNQAATVDVDGFAGRVFSGHVQEIASEAEFLPRNVQTTDDRQHEVFGVKVQVENPGGVLKSGMAATVHLQ